MAGKKQVREFNDFAPPEGDAVKVKQYSGELPEQAKLEEGDVVSGIFVGMKIITIKDQNTKQDKDVRVYTFKDKVGEKFAVLGRTMLDTAFDNVFENEGGDPSSIIGLVVRIERGKDTKLKGGRTLGNYDIKCWDQPD